MTIIEADGQTTEPLTVDFIQIFVGQRYSFIVRRSFNVSYCLLWVSQLDASSCS